MYTEKSHIVHGHTILNAFLKTDILVGTWISKQIPMKITWNYH